VPFPKKLLNQGEEVVLDLRPHWWSILPASLLLGVTVILGIASLVADGTLGSSAVKVIMGLLVLGALGFFVKNYLKWSSENFVVTSERVIYRAGVIAKKGIEIPLDRINTVFFNQSLFERLIGAGDLSIESAGEQGRQTFSEVRRPNSVQQEIYRQMERNEQTTYERQAQATAAAMGAVAGAGGGQKSIPEQIAELDTLRQRGLITDAEFQAKKADLLNRM
jgi:uncharacterized membrane protein YdbT with pleckstrin-like domain